MGTLDSDFLKDVESGINITRETVFFENIKQILFHKWKKPLNLCKNFEYPLSMPLTIMYICFTAIRSNYLSIASHNVLNLMFSCSENQQKLKR